MSVLFQRLVHGLPERHVPAKTSFATDAKSLRQWIAQLPLANPGATARLLIGGLREMNQLRIDPQQRLDALELLRPEIDRIVTTLGKQVIGDCFPLPPQKRKLGELAQDFEHELALGYCAVVYDFCAPAGAVPFLRGKPVVLALARALQHRGACLYQAYLRYQAPPSGAWQNMHDLFRFAVAVKLDEKPVEDVLYGAPTSVRLAYAQALLFAMSNPYRFTQRENSEIHALTRIWAEHCGLRQGRAPDGAVAIRTDCDRSIGYLPEEREAPEAGLWAFEINALVRFLDSHLALLPPGTQITQFGLRGAPAVHTHAAFVERLMRLWDTRAEREQERLPAGHLLDAVIGLHDLHYVLAGNLDFDSFLRKTRGVTISLQENEYVAAWAGPGSAQMYVKHPPAKVLDQSLRGYRLLWEKLGGMRVKVGELIGLATMAEDEEIQDWMIGAVRWLRIDPTGAMETGIELLARRATSVAVRSMNADQPIGATLRGVLFDALDGPCGSSDGATIMVPQLFDHELHEIELTKPGDPLGWPPEPTVETLTGIRAEEHGGGYLRIEIPSGTPGGQPKSIPADAANDDTGTSASVTAIGED
jgi:hypothetical protein